LGATRTSAVGPDRWRNDAGRLSLLMTDDTEGVRAVAPEHTAYWRGLAVTGYMGGPFTDRSGGLITFEIESIEKAEQRVANDPFLRRAFVKTRWLKEWNID
jgi:uncharacterized protein YciI